MEDQCAKQAHFALKHNNGINLLWLLYPNFFKTIIYLGKFHWQAVSLLHEYPGNKEGASASHPDNNLAGLWNELTTFRSQTHFSNL